MQMMRKFFNRSPNHKFRQQYLFFAMGNSLGIKHHRILPPENFVPVDVSIVQTAARSDLILALYHNENNIHRLEVWDKKLMCRLTSYNFYGEVLQISLMPDNKFIVIDSSCVRTYSLFDGKCIKSHARIYRDMSAAFQKAIVLPDTDIVIEATRSELLLWHLNDSERRMHGRYRYGFNEICPENFYLYHLNAEMFASFNVYKGSCNIEIWNSSLVLCSNFVVDKTFMTEPNIKINDGFIYFVTCDATNNFYLNIFNLESNQLVEHLIELCHPKHFQFEVMQNTLLFMCHNRRNFSYQQWRRNTCLMKESYSFDKILAQDVVAEIAKGKLNNIKLLKTEELLIFTDDFAACLCHLPKKTSQLRMSSINNFHDVDVKCRP